MDPFNLPVPMGNSCCYEYMLNLLLGAIVFKVGGSKGGATVSDNTSWVSKSLLLVLQLVQNFLGACSFCRIDPDELRESIYYYE